MRITTKNSLSVSIDFVTVLLSKVSLEENVIEDLLRQCRIPKHLLDKPDTRVSVVQCAELMKGLGLLTKDELFGHGLSPLPYGCTGLLVHWLITASNLEHAAHRITRFYSMLGQGESVISYKENGILFFELNPAQSSRHTDYFIAELSFYYIHRLLSWLAMEIIKIDHVSCQWKSPRYAQDYRLMFYGAPMHFEQQKTRIGFTLSVLSAPVNQSVANIGKFLDNPHFEIMVLDFKHDNLAARVAAEIRQSLHLNTALPEIAETMGMKPYTLQRRLAKEGITFLELKNQVKRDTAIDMLVNSDMTIEDISERLGFSETSPFTRTFKEWTGIAPSQYRRHH